jgi:hypothetical protein
MLAGLRMDDVIRRSLRYTSSQRPWALAILNWSNRLQGVKSARILSRAVGRLAATIPGPRRGTRQRAQQATREVDAAECLLVTRTDGGLWRACAACAQRRQPFLSASTLKPGGGHRQSASSQLGQGAPAPPQLEARAPSHGLSGWFSQTQWVWSQRGQIMRRDPFRPGSSAHRVPLSCSTYQPRSMARSRPALYSAGVALCSDSIVPLIFSM